MWRKVVGTQSHHLCQIGPFSLYIHTFYLVILVKKCYFVNILKLPLLRKLTYFFLPYYGIKLTPTTYKANRNPTFTTFLINTYFWLTKSSVKSDLTFNRDKQKPIFLGNFSLFSLL